MPEERTLLVTDVVDSTRIAQRLGDEAAARLWAAHDRAARDLLPAWRGREIDKTDGLLLLFDRAADALHYALAYHRALGALPVPLQARAGLHAGAVVLRENPRADVERGAKPLEVDGLAKPMAARVMALAQGGQTLLTAAARQALGPTALRVQSHGHWRLKGVEEPVEIFEAGEDSAPFAPPPDGEKAVRVVRLHQAWWPLTQVANNLPQPLNTFVGRQEELRALHERLAGARLVTVTGTGGLGKTRLALQAAARAMADFADGAWLVELAAVAEGEGVVQAVASALRVKEVPGQALAEALAAHLRPRQLLLVLDNCEHLLPACAALVQRLLAAAPRLVVLATSRERLRVAGEALLPLAPLPVPEGATADVPALAGSDAVRLFVERARAVQPGFALDARNAAAVAAVCSRLDGIPLALELAAARLRALPVEAVAARLADRFRLLSSGERTALPRQQTLRAMVDWSHDLLSDTERTLLRRLGVFAGGWTLPTAEAVVADDALPAAAVEDALAQLVDKSLVVAEPGAGRYRLLETIRAYALERLQAAGETAALRERHLAEFLALAREAGPQLWGAQQGEWVRRLDRERENLLAAHAFCGEGETNAAAGLRLLTHLQLYWLPAGLLETGLRLTEQALQRPVAESAGPERCAAHYAAAQLSYFRNRYEASLDHALRSLALARRIGASEREIDALLMAGYASGELGHHEAAAGHYAPAIALARETGDRARLGYALNAQAGHLWPGRAAEALPLYEEASALAREVDDRDALAVTQQNVARALLALGRAAEARAPLHEAVATAEAIGSSQGQLYAIDACIVLAAALADWPRVARLAGAIEAERARLVVARSSEDDRFVQVPLAAAQAELGPAAWSAAAAQGRESGFAAEVAATRQWLAAPLG